MASGIQHLALHFTPRHSSHSAARHFKLRFGTISMQMSAVRPITHPVPAFKDVQVHYYTPQDTFTRRTLSLTWSIMILLDPFLLQKTTCIYSLVFTRLPVYHCQTLPQSQSYKLFNGLDSSIIRCSYNPHVRSGGGGGQLSGEVKCLPSHDKPFHVLRQDDKFYRLHKNGLRSSVSLDHLKPAYPEKLHIPANAVQKPSQPSTGACSYSTSPVVQTTRSGRCVR